MSPLKCIRMALMPKNLRQSTYIPNNERCPYRKYQVFLIAGAYRLQSNTALRDIFLVKENGKWRAPKVNESCCVRPQLAALLREVAKKGPDALYKGEKAQVGCLMHSKL